MPTNIKYDDSKLQQLFSELTPKYRLKAIKGALSKEASRVRGVVVRNVRSDFHRADKDLERGVHKVVYRDKPGFKVTVMFTRGKRAKGVHRNRQGLLKPVLFWASIGTVLRRTKSRGWFKRRIKGHSTGRMPMLPFMVKAGEETNGTVTTNLRKAIVSSVEKTAKKYGAKI